MRIRSLLLEFANPVELVLVLAAILLWLILYRHRPRVTRGTVLATIPWIIAGAGYLVLPTVTSFIGGIGQYVTPLSVAAGTGLAFGFAFLFAEQVAEWHGTLESVPLYLGAIGSGAATIIVATVVWSGGPSLADFLWLTVPPIVAAIFAAVAIGILVPLEPDVVTYTGIAGALVVAGHTLDAVITVTRVAVFGPESQTALSQAVIEATDALPMAATGQFGWEYVVFRLIVAGVLVAILAPVARDIPERGYVALGLLVATGFGPATYALLLSTAAF